MRIAISTDGEVAAAHFVRREAYMIPDIGGPAVRTAERSANSGHEPGFLPGRPAERGAACITAGGMRPRAHGIFAERGVQTMVGALGSIAHALDARER